MQTKRIGKQGSAAQTLGKIDEGYIKNNFSSSDLERAKELLITKSKDKNSLREFLVEFPSPEDRLVLFVALVPGVRKEVSGKDYWQTLKAVLSENVDGKQPTIFTPGWTPKEVEIAEMAERLRDSGKLD